MKPQSDQAFRNFIKSSQPTNNFVSNIPKMGLNIIIISLLASLGISFLFPLCGCSGGRKTAIKAKESEAKAYVGSMNLAQQAYFVEKSIFSNSIEDLGVGISTQTKNYNYSIRVAESVVFNYAISTDKAVRSYIGGVLVIPATEVGSPEDEMVTIRILCEADSPGSIQMKEPIYE